MERNTRIAYIGFFCTGKTDFFYEGALFMKKLAVVGIIVTDRNKETVLQVQNVLNDFGSLIVGRMGVPDHESGFSAISLIVKGSVEEVSSLTGKIGKIANVKVKSAITAAEINEF